MHIHNRLITNGDGCRFITIARHTQKRACSNDIIATVKAKELQSGSCLRTILNLIENDNRITWDKLHLWSQKCRHHHSEMLHFQGTRKNGLGIGILKEIYVDDVFVISLGKLNSSKCLATLTAALDNYGFVVLCRFPLLKLGYYLTSKHPNPLILRNRYNSIINFFKRLIWVIYNFFKRLSEVTQNFFKGVLN